MATALLLEEGIFVECAVECAGVCDTVSRAGEELLDDLVYARLHIVPTQNRAGRSTGTEPVCVN